MRRDLETLARQLDMTQAIAFLGVRSDMPEHLRQLDLVVSTSHTEALPLAVMEAMATELPVVATAVGGVPELVVQGVTGILVPPGNADATAQAIVDLLENATRRIAMGAAGRARVLANFTLRASVEATATVLTELAHGRSGERRLSAMPAPERNERSAESG